MKSVKVRYDLKSDPEAREAIIEAPLKYLGLEARVEKEIFYTGYGDSYCGATLTLSEIEKE